MQHDHVTEVQIGARWIDSELNAQRTPECKALRELGCRFDVIEAIEQIRDAFVHDRSSTIVTPFEPSSSVP
jgi:hypothetical protein